MMDKCYEMNAPAVISEPMDEETVVINLDNGCYYNLNRTATVIWNSLQEGSSLLQIITHMTRLYPDDAETITVDFKDFLSRLMAETLIRETGKTSAAPVNLQNTDGLAYLKPDLEKFTDMQEMLLLDPIHEVSEAGWPHQKKK